MSDRGHFDLPELLERCLGDADFACELLGVFTIQAKAIWSELSNAVAANDLSAAVRKAHSLKGTTGNVAALSAHAMAENLERQLRNNQVDRGLMKRLGEELAACLERVPALLPTLRMAA